MTVRREIRATFSLAWPVVLAEIGWVLMGIVDTMMVGPLGPAAIGAVGMGSTLFFAVIVFGMGLFYAMDTYVAQSFGAGRLDECHRWLSAGLQLAAVLSVVLMALGFAGVVLLPATGIHPDVLAVLQPYLARLLWSTPPLLVFTVVRRYLQAMNVVRPIAIGIVAANVVNVVGNWAFVYGHAGLPAFGAIGSAYATLAARVTMAIYLWWILLWHERERPAGLHDVRWAWDISRMRRLVRLGLPAAVQVTLEVGVFAVAAALAGRISPIALAANQIVLNIASFFFMIPLGLSSAAAVRVGQAVGRRDRPGVRRAGWSALGLTAASAMVVAALFVTAPAALLSPFTSDPGVSSVGATILLLCAVFQPFDGVQAVATGALRGLGDTRTPMWTNLVGHWGIGLPTAYALCFVAGWGIVGLWAGLSLSLVLIGAMLLAIWHRRSAAW
ncbi:MAG: MATE family efflux transporter [Acidobacteria bacterium]|nr:MATE family efflux transporter [Acidobacteriota bacterium]